MVKQENLQDLIYSLVYRLKMDEAYVNSMPQWKAKKRYKQFVEDKKAEEKKMKELDKK